MFKTARNKRLRHGHRQRKTAGVQPANPDPTMCDLFSFSPELPDNGNLGKNPRFPGRTIPRKGIVRSDLRRDRSVFPGGLNRARVINRQPGYLEFGGSGCGNYVLFLIIDVFWGVGLGWVERTFMLGFACRLPASSTFQLHLKEKISETQQLTTLNPTCVSASPPQIRCNQKQAFGERQGTPSPSSLEWPRRISNGNPTNWPYAERTRLPATVLSPHISQHSTPIAPRHLVRILTFIQNG